FAAAQKQTRGLCEGPTQMRVADLLAGRALLLAARLVFAADQPRIAEEVAHVGEAADVVDFIKQHQRQDLAGTADRLQSEISLRVIDLGGARQVQLHVAEQFVVVVDETPSGAYNPKAARSSASTRVSGRGPGAPKTALGRRA